MKDLAASLKKKTKEIAKKSESVSEARRGGGVAAFLTPEAAPVEGSAGGKRKNVEGEEGEAKEKQKKKKIRE